MQRHDTENYFDFEPERSGGASFLLRHETIMITVKLHKTALDQLCLTVSDPIAKAQLFRTYRAVIEEIAYEKYWATQSKTVEISADDLLFEGRLLFGMCMV